MDGTASWSPVFSFADAPCPPSPGIYRVLLADAEALDGTPLGGMDAGSLLYIGKAERSLASRDLRQHLRAGGTGSSTLRRSLGAVLKQKLGLTAVPRNDGSTTSYRFDPAGEERLTDWMLSSLSISWLVCPNAEATRAMEPPLIRDLKPVLNISGSAGSEHTELIQRLRGLCREEAARSDAGGSAQTCYRCVAKPIGGGPVLKADRADAVNRFLQEYMARNGLAELDAVTAGGLLDREGILADREQRPGLPLRRLLRDGLIAGAYQDASRRWHIPRVSVRSR